MGGLSSRWEKLPPGLTDGSNAYDASPHPYPPARTVPFPLHGCCSSTSPGSLLPPSTLVTPSAPPGPLLLQALLEEINKAQEKLRSFDAEKQSCAVRLREAEAAAKSAAEQLESHDDGGRLPDATVWLMPFG